MKTKNHPASVLLVFITMFFAVSSCEKDEDHGPSAGNLTNGKTTALFNPDITYGTLTDQDGNVYKTVTIGAQTWMAENLRSTKYNDGTDIPNITDNNEWATLTTGAFCNYNNTSNIDSIATYGRLYNWYAVNTGMLAPKGWHVPTDEEWTALTNYLGGESIAGGKLKETGTFHWNSPNTGATNEIGFTAIPGGWRDYHGKFYSIGNYEGCWTATGYDTDCAWMRNIHNNYVEVLRGDYADKELGFSVRCVRD